MRRLKRVLVALHLFVLVSRAVSAQSGASIAGIVTDTSGATY